MPPASSAPEAVFALPGSALPRTRQAKLSGAIVAVAQNAAHPAAARPVAQLLPHLGPFGLGQVEVGIEKNQPFALLAGGARVESGDGARAVAEDHHAGKSKALTNCFAAAARRMQGLPR
jgi:hypothetical protein